MPMLSLRSSANISYRGEIKSTKAMCSTLIARKPNEGFGQFLTALRKLAATCEFGIEDEMLRDCIVTVLRDHGHRERLLRESMLT